MKTQSLIVATTILLSSCAAFAPDCPCSSGKKADDNRSKTHMGDQRLILAEGYSIMHKDATTIGAVRTLLYVKKESDEFHKIVTEVSDYGSHLKEELERLSKDYPAVRVDLDPLPEMEKRKRFSTGLDRFFEIAPLTGKKGAEFERTLLISLANGLNQERHLAEAMAKEEPNEQLKKFLTDTDATLTAYWKRADALLERRYFKP
jgi:hypothetical protein